MAEKNIKGEDISNKTFETSISLAEFNEIVNFVRKHHLIDGIKRDRQLIKTHTGQKDYYHIKYIETSVDTADGKIWAVTFRGVGINIRFSMQPHEELPEDALYFTLHNWIMAFLKGEWVPSEKMLRGKKGVDNIL